MWPPFSVNITSVPNCPQRGDRLVAGVTLDMRHRDTVGLMR